MSRASALGKAEIRKLAPLFSALGDPTRLALVSRLAAGGRHSVAALHGALAGLALTRQALSKHLRVLEEAGLLRSHRFGREQLWEWAPGSLADAQRALEQIGAAWDAALSRLRAFVEE